MTKHERALLAAAAAGEAEGWAMVDSLDGSAECVEDLATLEKIIAAYHRAMREPAEGEVRVRVAVLVTQEGCWSAAGEDDMSDEWAIQRAEERLMDANQIRWIEATVPGWQPLPEPVVEGEVVE